MGNYLLRLWRFRLADSCEVLDEMEIPDVDLLVEMLSGETFSKIQNQHTVHLLLCTRRCTADLHAIFVVFIGCCFLFGLLCASSITNVLLLATTSGILLATPAGRVGGVLILVILVFFWPFLLQDYLVLLFSGL